MDDLILFLAWVLVAVGALSMATLLFGLFFLASILAYYRLTAQPQLHQPRCPRCDQAVPFWQPVHLSCFFIRSWYWLSFGFMLLLVLTTLIPVGFSIVLGR